jgi:hypothetical protein
VWAVGDAGTIQHWDGRAWTSMNGLPIVDYEAVWGRRQDDVWVAGSLHFAEATVLHWDGATWSDTHFPIATSLRIVSGGDDGTPWVADVRGSIWTWDGKAWSLREKAYCPVAPGTQGSFCDSGILRTAGGGTLFESPGPHGDFRDVWDGSALARRTNPPSPIGRTFGGARESSLLLRTDILDSGQPTLQRWDGRRWASLGDTVPIRGGRRPYLGMVKVRALWGASDSDVWAVGDGGQILRYDGSDWHAVETRIYGDLNHVWSGGPDDAWATGTSGTLRWDGTRWMATTTSVSDADLHGVWGVDSCHVWAVGAAGTVLRRDCDGWSRVASGVGVDLWGVGGTGDSDVWVVGDGGTVLHFDGTGRRLDPSPSHRNLRGVWAATTDDAWAVGDGAPVLHWDGTGWSEVPLKRNVTLRTVRGPSANLLTAVGDGGATAAWDGAPWSLLAIRPRCKNPHDPTRDDAFTSLWARARDDVWVTCRYGGPTHWDGIGWVSPENAPALGYLEFTDGAGFGDAVLVIRSDGSVFQWSGDQWTQPARGVSTSLRAVWSSDQGEVWAVGDRGTIVSSHHDGL